MYIKSTGMWKQRQEATEIKLIVKTCRWRLEGRTAQRLRALALTEATGSVPSTHTQPLTTVSGNLMPPAGLLGHCTCDTHKHAGKNNYVHSIKINTSSIIIINNKDLEVEVNSG